MDMFSPQDRVKVITSVQRRRCWTTEEKVAIVQETFAPGSQYRWCRFSMAWRPISSFNGASSTLKEPYLPLGPEKRSCPRRNTRRFHSKSASFRCFLARGRSRRKSFAKLSSSRAQKSSSCARPCPGSVVRNETDRRHLGSRSLEPVRERRSAPQRARTTRVPTFAGRGAACRDQGGHRGSTDLMDTQGHRMAI